MHLAFSLLSTIAEARRSACVAASFLGEEFVCRVACGVNGSWMVRMRMQMRMWGGDGVWRMRVSVRMWWGRSPVGMVRMRVRRVHAHAMRIEWQRRCLLLPPVVMNRRVRVVSDRGHGRRACCDGVCRTCEATRWRCYGRKHRLRWRTHRRRDARHRWQHRRVRR